MAVCVNDGEFDLQVAKHRHAATEATTSRFNQCKLGRARAHPAGACPPKRKTSALTSGLTDVL
eukprot:10663524-Prorocentrum_lima.AAC.1